MNVRLELLRAFVMRKGIVDDDRIGITLQLLSERIVVTQLNVIEALGIL